MNASPFKDPVIVHGSDCSYYTGKIEAYLRAKGIDYRLEMFTPLWMRRCVKNTGVRQIPQVECPDGTWLLDTTPTIAYLESVCPGPKLSPADPVVRFVSLLLEDYADEWLWRPAMHYRWSYRSTAKLMSAWLAEHLSTIPAPAALKRAYWLYRQPTWFVRRDGVTASTRAATEASYLESLQALEAIFEIRPFILGEIPTEADFGFFASMFRHFFSDPAPARIMRSTAPGVNEWVARMWNLRPELLTDQAPPTTLPERIEPLLEAVAHIYLPYLAANADAHNRGSKEVTYTVQNVQWREPVKPYRVRCLAELHGEFAKLDEARRAAVADALADPRAVQILEREPHASTPPPAPTLPLRAGSRNGRPLDSWWRTI